MNQNPGYPLANENVPYNPDLEHFLPMGQQMTEVHQVQMMAQHPSPPYPNTYLPTNFYQPHSFTSYPYPPQSFHPPLPYPVPGPAWPTFSAFPVATTQPFSESCSTPSAPPHPIEETCERSLESQGLDLPSAVCSTEELDSCPTVTNEIVNVSSGIEAVALSTPDNAEYCLPSSSYPIIENISINNQCPSSSSNVSDDVAVPVQFQPQLVNSANHSTDAHASQSTLKMNSESIENDVRVNEGTIRPFQPFCPLDDAERLRKAIKEADEKIVINILANRSHDQRIKIAEVYKERFGKDLVKDFKNELSGDVKTTVRALMMPRLRYLAKCIRFGVIGHSSLASTCIEVLCTSSNSEIIEINKIYKKEFKLDLGRDLRRECNGYLGHLLVSMNCGNRNESEVVDEKQVSEDVKKLIHDSKIRWTTATSVFSTILVSRSYLHLQAVFIKYEAMCSHPFETVLRKEVKNEALRDCLLSMITCIRNKITYFAQRLHRAFVKVRIDNATIIRILVSRSELDLNLIEKEYTKLHRKKVSDFVNRLTSGDYRRILLAILKE